MIRCFYADASPLRDPAVMRQYYRALSEERRQKADRCHADSNKMLSVAAGFLLETRVRELFGISRDRIRYQTVQNGKPVFAGDAAGIGFNLSHSKGFVLCALYDGRDGNGVAPLLGCDIEKIRPLDLRIADRFFFRSEYRYIMSRQDTEAAQQAFFRLWTLKESFMKAAGLGFALPLNAFEISFDGENRPRVTQKAVEGDFCFDEYERDGFRIAICSPKALAGDRKGDASVSLERYQWPQNVPV